MAILGVVCFECRVLRVVTWIRLDSLVSLTGPRVWVTVWCRRSGARSRVPNKLTLLITFSGLFLGASIGRRRTLCESTLRTVRFIGSTGLIACVGNAVVTVILVLNFMFRVRIWLCKLWLATTF